MARSDATDSRVVALIVVDPLKRFTEADAPFAVSSSAEVIRNVNTLAKAARAAGVPVVWTTRLVRGQVGLGKRTESKYAGVIDAFAGRWAELDDRLDVQESDVILEKPRHSAFFSTDLDTVLRSWRVTDVLITGLTTNVCCLATAFDAVARDYHAVFVSDALGARSIVKGSKSLSEDEVNEMTFLVAEYAVGEIMTTAEVLERLG